MRTEWDPRFNAQAFFSTQAYHDLALANRRRYEAEAEAAFLALPGAREDVERDAAGVVRAVTLSGPGWQVGWAVRPDDSAELECQRRCNAQEKIARLAQQGSR